MTHQEMIKEKIEKIIKLQKESGDLIYDIKEKSQKLSDVNNQIETMTFQIKIINESKQEQ